MSSQPSSATFKGLLCFAVSPKLGHAVEVLACAAVDPEAFLALPAASGSFSYALLCSAGVHVTSFWSECSWGEGLFPVLEGFVQLIKVLVLGVVLLEPGVASFVGVNTEHVICYFECALRFAEVDRSLDSDFLNRRGGVAGFGSLQRVL